MTLTDPNDPFATEEPFIPADTDPATGNGSQPEALDLTTHGESLVTVRVDGEDVIVPLSEAVQGYSRTQDYTRKTQELANERTNLEAGLEEVRQYRQWGEQIGRDPQAALTSIAEAYGIDRAGVGNIDDSYGDESPKVAQLEAQMKQLSDQLNRQGAASDIERETKATVAAGLVDDPEALLQYAASHNYSQGQLAEAAKAMAYEDLKGKLEYIESLSAEQDATDQAIVEQKVGLPPQAGGALRGGPQPVGAPPGSPGEKVPFSDAFNQAVTQYTNS